MKEKKNEILEEQRRARKSFLELKKAQSENGTGETSEAALPEEKKFTFSDFIYYYKYHIIIILFLAVLISVATAQCVHREKYDLKIAIHTTRAFSDEQVAGIEDYFSLFAEDTDTDGKVNVLAVNCAYEVGVSTAEYQQTQQQKIQSMIVTDTSVMLFILNKDTVGYLDSVTESGLIEKSLPLPDSFYEKTGIDKDKELYICLRKIKNTFMEENGDAKAEHEKAEKILGILE